MKSAQLLPVYLLLVFSQNAFGAERFMAVLGGKGEPVKQEHTLFDRSLSSLGDYLKDNKWNYDISFNGGHSKTDAIIDSKFSEAKNKSTFTQKNYDALIADYIKKIEQGEIKAGDQLLVMINSHGSPQVQGEKSHHIAVGDATTNVDFNTLSAVEQTSLDSLEKLTKLAAAKKIKLGIVDFSCHSGGSLSLANSNTCVISSTGPNHLATNIFAEDFMKNMKPGASLEEAFLQTRKEPLVNSDAAQSSYPMISTPEGMAIKDDIYPGMTSLLYSYDPKSTSKDDKMPNYILESASNVGMCKREMQLEKLQTKIEEYKAISALGMNSNVDLSNLKKLVNEYKDRQGKVIRAVQAIGIQDLYKQEAFDVITPFGTKTLAKKKYFSWKDIVETDYAPIISQLTTKLAGKEDVVTRSSLKMFTKAQEKQKEILKQYPNLKNYQDEFKQQMNELKGTEKIANAITAEERKLYDFMYKNLRQNNQRKDACKDFIL